MGCVEVGLVDLGVVGGRGVEGVSLITGRFEGEAILSPFGVDVCCLFGGGASVC